MSHDPIKTVLANEIRSTGPTWNRFPANLPQVAYITDDGGQLCVTCANGGNESEATLKESDDPSDRQWQIIGAQTWSDPVQCDHCNRTIQPLAPGSAMPTVQPTIRDTTYDARQTKLCRKSRTLILNLTQQLKQIEDMDPSSDLIQDALQTFRDDLDRLLEVTGRLHTNLF
jgi:hypothetical protein